MADKLSLYNGALRILKERKLASVTENREPRRLLDDAWGNFPSDGAVKFCLQMGQWTFATRMVQLDFSPSVEPPFGYRYAFDQPEDMVRVTGLWQDEYGKVPLLEYVDERHYWFAPLQTIYVSYVSNDVEWGADISLWPETFVKLVEAYLAREIAGNLTQGTDMIALAERAWKDAKTEASALDAMNRPTKFMPTGSWNRSRNCGGTRSRSGGWS